MAFPLPLTGSELAIYPQDDAVAGSISNGQNATLLLDYSGNGRTLTAESSYPIFEVPSVNGKAAVVWDGTKNPLINTASFSLRCGFMVVKINEASFSNYAGILTDTSAFPILLGNSGTANFYDNLQDAYLFEYRLNDRIYSALNAPAPMHDWKIIFFRYWKSVTVNGIQIGQDRADIGSKAKMSLALLGLYSRDFCEEDIRANLQILANTFGLPLADVFPLYVDNASTYRDTQAANLDFPPSGGQIAEILGEITLEGDLKFANRKPQQTKIARDYLRTHFGSTSFILRSFAFLPPEDYLGFATSLLEYSADGKNCSFGFRETGDDDDILANALALSGEILTLDGETLTFD